MTPQRMIDAMRGVQERWPDATIRGHYGNASVGLEVVLGGMVIARVGCSDGTVTVLSSPLRADGLVRFV